jgi:MFS family permease
LLTRIQQRNRLLTIAFIATGILFLGAFGLPNLAVAVVYMVILGFVSNLIPTAVFTLAPATMPRLQLAGLALAIVTMGAGLGVLLGPPVLGSILSRGNWFLGGICLAVVMGIGTLASVLTGQRMGNT